MPHFSVLNHPIFLQTKDLVEYNWKNAWVFQTSVQLIWKRLSSLTIMETMEAAHSLPRSDGGYQSMQIIVLLKNQDYCLNSHTILNRSMFCNFLKVRRCYQCQYRIQEQIMQHLQLATEAKEQLSSRISDLGLTNSSTMSMAANILQWKQTMTPTGCSMDHILVH